MINLFYKNNYSLYTAYHVVTCPVYCKRSLDFGMKETLKKRIVDIDTCIENLLLLSPYLRQRETEKMDET